jgi:putative transcriptional regulator
LRVRVKYLPDPAPEFKARDIKMLREKILKLTQNEFALVLNVAVITVRSWEQGIRKPEKVCNRLLQILKENPKIVRALSKSA